MNLITHHSVFGETRCWLYSVEWQKQGLAHAHILIWLVDKVCPEEIDKIISAEIPDPNVDLIHYILFSEKHCILFSD